MSPDGPRDLRVLVAGGADLADAVLPPSRSGSSSTGLAESVQRSFGVTIVVDHLRDHDATMLLAEGGDAIAAADVLLHSLAPELARPETGQILLEQVRADLEALIARGKAERTWIVILNASTLDPGDRGASRTGGAAEATLDRHRLDLLLLDLSVEQGISIVDVDRLVAERGGEGNVIGPLVYSEALSSVIGAEVLRVLEDYGFFDERQLLEQRGRGAAA